MRCFIALLLDKDANSYILDLQRELKESSADVKWVEPQNIHLTLKFLGEIPEKLAQDIKIKLEDFKEEKVIKTKIFEIGGFPSLENARVVWVGLKDEKMIKDLFERLERKLQQLNIPKEKRDFKAHITLGRVRSKRNIDKLIRKIKKMKFKEKDASIEKLVFFQSTLTQRGPIYTPLYEISFKRI